jgi:hypothetical protein
MNTLEIVLMWALGISFLLNCYWYFWILPRAQKKISNANKVMDQLVGKAAYYKELSDKAHQLAGAMRTEFSDYVTKAQAREIESFEKREALKKEIAFLKTKNKK